MGRIDAFLTPIAPFGSFVRSIYMITNIVAGHINGLGRFRFGASLRSSCAIWLLRQHAADRHKITKICTRTSSHRHQSAAGFLRRTTERPSQGVSVGIIGASVREDPQEGPQLLMPTLTK